MKHTVHIILALAILVTIYGYKNSPEHAEVKDKPAQKTEIIPSDQSQKKKKLTVVYADNKKYLKAYYELPHIKEFYGWMNMSYSKLPPLNYPTDLSTLTYEELRLLRNEVFARNGYLFNDGYLRGYFNQYKWYMPIFDVNSYKISLNKEEKDLINKILEEEAKRKKDKTVTKDGLNLYNYKLVANTKQFAKIPPIIQEDLEKQNFSIVNTNRSMPFYIYDKNAYQYIPHYITTDLYLFILHKYFSCFLEKLDENYMYKQLFSILRSTSDKLEQTTTATHQTALQWAKTYNATALYAIGDSLSSAPKMYSEQFAREKTAIDNQNGLPSFISNEFVNYKELKPRGHYSKNNKLRKYFRCFKWISLNGINLDNEKELKGLVLFAYTIKTNNKLFNQYKQYTSTITKLTGHEDNLSISDIINSIESESIDKLLSESNINRIKNKLKGLNKEKIKKVFGESFQTAERDIKRVYFLSSTYSLSGEIFSKLVNIDGKNSKRPFPRALDIPAVFGNKTAQNIIINEFKDNEAWPDYLPRLQMLQNQFKNFSHWNHNYGFKGVQTALNACGEQDSYPDFMKTKAYNRKELSTTLSSWTHIKHDLILYQEKPFAAECGQGGGPQPPKHYSYVEPNILFWNSALDLVKWLEQLANNEPTFGDELRRIKELGITLRDISKKELNGEKITNKEYENLHYIGGTIEYLLLGLLETDHLPDRERSMALIADVYTYNGKNINVAVGHADDIYTIVPIKGEYYIARGSVFSFYEFKGELLNDEQWKARVQNNNVPQRPQWIKPLINKTEPLKGQMHFRYSGS